MTEINIRRAQPDDLPSICRLCFTCVKHMNLIGIPQWDEIYPNEEIFRQDIIQGCLYAAAAPDGEIAGCIVLNTRQDEEYQTIDWQFIQGRAAVIHRLIVRPDYEGNGIARSLLSFAENLAREQGFAAVRLDMFTLNPRATALYQRNGYRVRGTVKFRKGLFYCAEKLLAE